jgi:CheY-like chemotaxis protein
MELQFKNWGVDFALADTPSIALELMNTEGPFDLVIMDLNMPDMSGLDLGKEISSLYSENTPPLILLSSGNRESESDDYQKLFFASVSKPIRQAQLFDIVSQAFKDGKSEKKGLKSSKIIKPLNQDLPLSILVAEDDKISQTVTTKLLNSLGYKPDVVEDGKMVLEKLKVTSYDLILMDIAMPELDGIETTKTIISNWPETKQPIIIALTANAMLGDREKFLNAGMKDHIYKPVTLQKLSSCIEEWGRKIVET